ncbi:type II and III secretion system protein family protein [Blastopirellula marina]|uniref:Secretion system protein n=1 Tax=Blastopirellula marina TaxID=124 RepID=A0A2S8G0S6_9BACT|nr:pilus assembly protein N-terminal domain-containing protein [Blastopirellula marina]PQO38048.1 secretion system protein [Blastopirellula marina]PTL44704.1 secretion system protein [Blastopirellula marina]
MLRAFPRTIICGLFFAIFSQVADVSAQSSRQPLVHEFQNPLDTNTLRIAQAPVRPAEVPRTQLTPELPLQAPGVDRLERLDSLPPGLQAPLPTEETQQTYGQFLQGTIDPENTLTVIEGRPRILVFKETPIRIYLPDDRIATYQVISDREISLVGIRRGTTVLNIWVADPTQPNGQRILSYLVRVQPDAETAQQLSITYANLMNEINQAFPDSFVDLQFVGNQLIVRGQAKDALEAMQILRVIAANSPSTNARTEVRDGEVVLRDDTVPTVTDQVIQQNIQAVNRQLRAANIVNLLQIPGDQQVMLKVTVAEVNRTAARELGIDFTMANSAGTIFRQTTAGVLTTGASATSTASNIMASLDGGQVDIAIRALRTLKLAKSLAEPTLTTLNGQTASFSAGGRFPIPSAIITNGGSAQGVRFVPFGVQLDFTPNIVDRDRIRLVVDATVSSRDESLGTSVGGSSSAGGTSVSGLQSNDFSTTVELREGQTLAVAGLISNSFGSDAKRIPYWGDLPFIGGTGGLNQTSANEKELVVLITPQLVHPIEACDGPALPGDDIHEPNDIEFFLLNRLEGRHTKGYRSTVRTDHARQHVGNHCDECQFLIGPTGRAFDCCRQPVLYR